MSTSPAALQVLSVIANPSDLPRLDDARLGRQLQDALAPFQSQGALHYERLKAASASALQQSLSATQWNVVHVIAHGQDHAAAHYGTLAFESSDGRSRNITGQALAALLAPCPSLALVVMQSPCEGPPCFNSAAEELIQRGIRGVLVAPLFPDELQKFFLTRLYEGLLREMSPRQLVDHVGAERPADAAQLAQLHIVSREPERGLFTPARTESASPETAPSVKIAPPPVAVAAPAPVVPPWQEILRTKRSAQAFDVFLCHNSADKPMVRRICQQLKEAGILPWLDVEELPPGQPWQPLLEKQIKNIRAAAVCFGAAGIGPWQEREMYGFLNAFVKRGVPVIPLLLPDASSVPDLPIFLDEMTWVDFRCPDPDPLVQLIWGITGTRPDLESR